MFTRWQRPATAADTREDAPGPPLRAEKATQCAARRHPVAAAQRLYQRLPAALLRDAQAYEIGAGTSESRM